MNNLIRKPFAYSYWNTSLVLIIANIIVYVIQRLMPVSTIYLSLSAVGVIRYHYFWQFVTYMFAHGGISHILFNMLALFMFGSAVEKRIGSKEFLLYYFITGIGAGVFSFIVYLFSGTNALLLGASGALFAVQLAYAVLFPQSIIYIWGIIPLRAPVMVLLFTAVELFSAFTNVNSGVAHLTHLAGFGFGYVYFLARFSFNPAKALQRRIKDKR
jgi:membrane associated rhomboid family serine protease